MSTHSAGVSASLFGAELRKALQVRNVTQAGLALAVGKSARQVNFWCRGLSYPFLATGVRIAEALDWPRIAVMVRSHRTVHCRACRRPIVSEATGSPRRYCNSDCRRLAVKKGVQEVFADPVSRQLQVFQAAVGAMCAECEPTGLCRDALCRLRCVSPLPYVGVAKAMVQAPVGRRSRWDDPAQRENLRVQMVEKWSDPEWAAAQTTRAAAAKKAKAAA